MDFKVVSYFSTYIKTVKWTSLKASVLSHLIFYILLCSTAPYFALLFFAIRCYLNWRLVSSFNVLLHSSVCRLYFSQPCSALLYPTLPMHLYSSVLHFTVIYLLYHFLSLLSSLSYLSLSAMLYPAQLWSTLFYSALPCFNLLCCILLLLYSTRVYSILLAILSHPVTAPMLGWTSSTTCIFAGLALQKVL